MRLELTDIEARDLRDFLRASLGDMSMEISHTDSADYRQMLKQRRERLLHVLHQLDLQAEGEATYV